MAGDWIKMRTNLCGDPAVKAMSRTLKLDVFSVVGRLHEFWAWADQHTDSGEMPFTVLDDVDDVVQKRGFASEMVRVGWLIDNGNEGVSVPKWDRHNGESAKKRGLSMERQRSFRARSGNAAVTELSRRERYEDVTESEQERDQRREEKSISPVVPNGDGKKADDPELSRARKLFRMRESTPLDSSQVRSWKKNRGAVKATTEEDWRVLEWWFSTDHPEANFRRRDLATLLNNWNAEICRAGEVARKVGMRFSEKKENGVRASVMEIDGWREIYATVMGEECPDVEWDRIPQSIQLKIANAAVVKE